MRTLILSLAVCCLTSVAQAGETLRYALLGGPTAMEVSQNSLFKTSGTGEVKYFLNTKEVTFDTKATAQDESVIDWTPMSIEAFGYDIREVWKPKSWGMFSYSLAFSR